MATLNVENKIVAFGDVAVTNNPRLKYADWFRTAQGVAISKPVTDSTEVNIGDFYDIAGDDHTVGVSYDITSVDAQPTRTKIYGNFGHTAATLTHLEQIEVLVNGQVKFHFAVADSLIGINVGDCFYVKGVSTDDAKTDVSNLNEGLWRVASVVTSGSNNYLACQKLDGCTGSISQAVSDVPSIVVFRDPVAKRGNYAYVKEVGSDTVKPLFQVIYADSERIDIDFVPFEIDLSGKLTITQNRYKFAYIESDGTCEIIIQTGIVDKSVLVTPLSLPSGEKIGWFQITSDFNFIQVKNIDNQPIKVSAIVGG